MRKLLFVLIIIDIVLSFYYGISRHYNYMTSYGDLGLIDKTIWGIFNGENYLYNSGHFEPVLYLFVPFYYLKASVVWLIVAQSIAIPLTALPIYFLSLRIYPSERVALFWAASCIFSPFMLSALSWDFHPISLAVPFVAAAFFAVEKRNPAMLFLACIFVLSCKEHFGILVIGFGLLWFLVHRDYKVSLFLIVLGAGYFVFVMEVLIPAFSPTGKHLMFAGGEGMLSRYGWLGNSVDEVIVTILSNPLKIIQFIFYDMKGWAYILLLLLPLLFLPLLACEFIIPGVADLLANLLSTNPMPRSIFAYHSATLIPVMVVAAIYGSHRAVQIFRSARPEKLSQTVLIITLALGWFAFPFYALPGGLRFWEPKRVIEFHDPNYEEIREIITPDMSVSVQSNIGAHFTQRKEVYRYPDMVGHVDAVVLHLDSPTLWISKRNPTQVKSLGHHLQMDPHVYLNSVKKLLISDIYKKIVWKDPWLILLKGETEEKNNLEVLKKINQLYIEWDVLNPE